MIKKVKSIKQRIKNHIKEVLELKTSPKEIALGFAIGTFFANFPTFGLEILIIFLILIIFKKVSKISLLLAYVVWNPLITYPLAVVNYLIGDYILRDIPIITIKFTWFQELIRLTVRYIVGSLFVATIAAIVSYFVVYYLVKAYYKKQLPILQKPLLEE